MKKTVM